VGTGGYAAPEYVATGDIHRFSLKTFHKPFVET